MAVPDKKICNQSLDRLSSLTNLALSGEGISADDAIWLFSLPHEYSDKIMQGASLIRETFRGNAIDPCTVMNAKSGACGEDCHFCSQSSHHSTISPEFEMVSKEKYSRQQHLLLQMGQEDSVWQPQGGDYPTPSKSKRYASLSKLSGRM